MQNISICGCSEWLDVHSSLLVDIIEKEAKRGHEASMNIFLLDTDKAKCAQAYPDKLVVNQPREHAQMLASAMQKLGLPALLKLDGSPYGITHANHPCTQWASASYANALYVAELGYDICLEYTRVYGKEHGCAKPLLQAIEQLNSYVLSTNVEAGPMFPIVVGEQCLAECWQLGHIDYEQIHGTLEQAVVCYRHYIASRKLHYACWSHNRAVPSWWPGQGMPNGWLSCKVPKLKHSTKQSSRLAYAKDANDEADTDLSSAFVLEAEPIKKPRATKQSTSGRLVPVNALPVTHPDAILIHVPAFSKQQLAEAREYCQEHMMGKLPTSATLAKWADKAKDDEHFVRFIAEHMTYWSFRGYAQ